MSTNQQAASARRCAMIGLAPLLSVLFVFFATQSATAAFLPCGDANGDGSVTASDAFAALRGAVGLSSPCVHNCNCDPGSDRNLSSSDALLILRAAVSHDSLSCSVHYECLHDTDCDGGDVCGADPEWSCDKACVPE